MKTLIQTVAATTGVMWGTAAISAPVQWDVSNGGNGHWYEFVTLTTDITATEAEVLAESSTFLGETGYLATITSAAEQIFLNTLWPGAGSVTGQFNNYSYFLIGASDRETEGNFEWIGGPEEGEALGYTNFRLGEPNDFNAGEDYVVAWWADSPAGLWNDIPGQAVRAYLVEYNDAPSVTPVPLPAGFPMLLAGLVGFGWIAKRRKEVTSA